MDFRTPRPTERPAVNRPEPRQRQPEEPQPIKEAPIAVQHIGASHHIPKEEKPKKRFVLPIIAVIIVIILVLAGWFMFAKGKSGSTAIDSSKYQAVFFTNGQVYFGKLQSFNDDYLKLTNIFYLQTQASADTKTDSKNPQTTTTDQSNVQLIKLGQEVHGPEDEMIISKDQVLFYENLKSDGKVAQKIDEYNKQ